MKKRIIFLIAVGIIVIAFLIGGIFFAPHKGPVLSQYYSSNYIPQASSQNNSRQMVPANMPANSPYYDSAYFTTSSDPTSFPTGTLVAQHASVPDAIQISQSVGNFKSGEILVYFVDFEKVTGPGTETLGLEVSNDSGKSWGKRIAVTVTGKVNAGGIVDPSIVQLPDGKLRLYFFGSEITSGDPLSQQGPHKVYSAVSDNGINFTVENGVRFEAFNLTDPEIVYFNHEWFMYYSLINKQGLAISSDGLNFTGKGTLNNNIGGVPGAMALSNGVRIYGCAQGISTGFASNGINFTLDGTNVVQGGLCDPSPLKLVNGKYALVYKIHQNPN